jgi:tetratricopeptide (TPR) repeat protein
LRINEQLAAESPNDPVARLAVTHLQLQLAQILQETRQTEEAQRLLRASLEGSTRLVADFPSTTQYRAGLAGAAHTLFEMLRDSRRFEEAEQVYRSSLPHAQKLVADAPDRVWYWQSLLFYYRSYGSMQVTMQRVPEAEAAYREAMAIGERIIRDFPYDSKVQGQILANYASLGSLLRRSGRAPEALAPYRRGIELAEQVVAARPTHIVHRQTLANLLRGIIQIPISDAYPFEEAQRHYRRQISLLEQWPAEASNQLDQRSQIAMAHSAWGRLAAQCGQVAEAERAFREAVSLLKKLTAGFPETIKYGVELAETYRGLGTLLARDKPAEGEAAYRLAIERYEQCAAQFNRPVNEAQRAGSYLDLARLLAAEGRHEEAQTWVEKVLQVQPVSAMGQNNLAWLLATVEDPKFRHPARAVELAQKAVELAPKQRSYWNTLGAAQYRAEDWTAAVAALEKSMELGAGGDARDWFFLAMAHWQLGEKEEARKWRQQAIDWTNKHAPVDEELRRFQIEAQELIREQAIPRPTGAATSAAAN